MQEAPVHSLMLSSCAEFKSEQSVLRNGPVHSLCIAESEHLNYKLIMSGVAHQRLSQVSGDFLRLLTPLMH